MKKLYKTGFKLEYVMRLTDEEFEKLQNKDPFDIFNDWFDLACEKETLNPNAMTLATARTDGMPEARTVLLKSVDKKKFIFYTNTESRKGHTIKTNPQAALLFYWKTIGRQILIEGHVKCLSASETEPYFHSRPLGSRIGAWASEQSQPIESLVAMRKKIFDHEKKFRNTTPPLPPHWRGYALNPNRIEFWQEGDNRLHHRVVFNQTNHHTWNNTLLQP